MSKHPIARTLQLIFLILMLSSLATAMNNTQFATSPSFTPASNNINSSSFRSTPALENIAGSANSSQFSTCLGIGCTITTCGNNILESGEACEGAELGGQTCVTRGYASGTLRCNAACSGFDVSECIAAPQPQGPGAPSAPAVGAGGKATPEKETTTTTASTTTTTLVQPQPELPTKIPERITQALRQVTQQLSALESETGKLYKAVLLIVAALCIYLLYLILKFIRKKVWPRIQQRKLAQQQEQQAQQQQQQELQSYIRQNLELGHPPSFIISTLLQHGWEKEELQQALEQVLKEMKR